MLRFYEYIKIVLDFGVEKKTGVSKSGHNISKNNDKVLTLTRKDFLGKLQSEAAN